MSSRWLPVLALLLTPACSLARGVTATADGGGLRDTFVEMDVAPEDSGTDEDAFVEADMGVEDAFSTDMGTDAFVAPDAFVEPDAFVPSDTGPPRTPCNTTYGGLLGYGLCTEAATTCTFTFYAGTGTCAATCAGRGASCFMASTVSTGNLCLAAMTSDCSLQAESLICVCDRLP